MPAFVLVPASPSDLEAVARVQFAACASDHGFPVVFPKGATLTSITHYVRSYEYDLENDPTCHLMVVKEAMSGEIASFAVWHFFPPKSQEEVEQEMLIQEVPLPDDANKELANRLVRNSIRKRHEVVASAIGTEKPYAYLAVIGTSPKYQKQGAASLLLQWGLERADDLELAAYVESAPPALRLYEKYGFKEVSKLPLEMSPWKDGEYLNVCMVRQPSS
ncbi:uncharacterized protein Z520_09841 [Fonsecaea multimorphosa CBS 102226]|uniref:N-acetyltransferase domain-containing protein n=1 Tax=Fonsecaea multimorphosa CBS 102226 TaxID=1442371 RepID=A0A0D2GY40_9EURO|nr:uncharacterized protein Z520_09841 [Fonsecaea multimorphosa CBS 102226]KIX94455.1 hypothetical protein Z520_09841 [Fonsecaea multimorphosa CBS 102226]OAL20035.1 hypothetical protein AYO22_09185 [Fonsecaea multimorphosa]